MSGWFVYRRAPFGMAVFMGGFGGGILLVSVVSWLTAIPKRIIEWLLIVRARFGGEPRDGKRAAIIGTLRGHGELTTPFTRERCVLYSYEIVVRENHGNETRDRKAWEGFAMVPLSIEHGTQRTRLLARPELPLLKPAHPSGHAAEEHAKVFVENTDFVVAPKSGGEKDLSHTAGHLRYDYRNDPAVAEHASWNLVERHLPAGIDICALGTYRADRHALVAPVTLRTGSAFGIGAAWRVVNAAIAAVIFAAITVAAAALVCVHFPLDAVEQSHPHWNLRWWEIDLERFVDRNVRMPMVRAGVLNEPGFRLQSVCDGCAKGRLEIDGRTIELAHTAYRGGRAVHLSATPGARDGVTLDGRDRVTLTVNGKTANVPPSWIQPHDIETSLGSEGEYAGRVTFVAPDRSIRCRVSFATMVDEDAWLPGGGAR